jgi:hypothetical protein
MRSVAGSSRPPRDNEAFRRVHDITASRAVRWLARLALEVTGRRSVTYRLAAAVLAQLWERPKTAARTLLELAS